ncbi:MAG: exopolysaccharide biosynthesis polyprenyl glycosylphosphotransferase [Planctomycetes bacterium]|nr:exopolysaccharide biosynthesis polyprenyl glycosylphosphotransferase [Planctomycetota bacterium]
MKRLFDLSLSAAVLVVLSPLLAVCALAVWAESGRPILFLQTRVGRRFRPFRILKFRSMTANASGASVTVGNDPRVTAVGSVLRKWKLDELPQFWNVFRGDMSLVGPRPERPEFVEEFKEQIPKYLRRHKMKAGLTGWAQTHGWRGNTSIEKRIECDLWYIANWSLSLDMEIMLKTVVELLRGGNAY